MVEYLLSMGEVDGSMSAFSRSFLPSAARLQPSAFISTLQVLLNTGSGGHQDEVIWDTKTGGSLGCNTMC